MNRTEKLVNELQRIHAQETDAILKQVLEHLIEDVVPAEIADAEDDGREPRDDYDAVSADEANDRRIEIYNNLK